METNGINLNPGEEKKDSKRTVFALGALAALGLAGALGLGFMLGGENSQQGDNKPAVRREASVSPTAAANQPSNNQTGTGSTQPVVDTSDSGDTSSDDTGEEPAPATNTAVPPAETPIVPTETPVAPTETPTEEPSPTPTATPGDGCPFCIDPGIIVVLDLVAPVFESGGRTHCDEGTIVVVTLDEDADIWVTYTMWGSPFASEIDHGTFGYFNLGGGPFIFPAMNIEVHAQDAWGNESTFEPPLYDCP